MVIMIAMTPSLKASSRPLFILSSGTEDYQDRKRLARASRQLP
jgi:hypothetical protein